MSRRADLDHLYELLRRLEHRVGAPRRPADCSGRMGWPRRGVYFIFEDGEYRENGTRARVVRVGTHGLRAGSRSTLWGRLKQHKGTGLGDRLGGNHRGSVFRLHIGRALLARGLHPEAGHTWAVGSSTSSELRRQEAPLEATVSRVIGAMRVLWVDVPDDPGPGSMRGVIEANAIALLSNLGRSIIDPPSISWLGSSARSRQVRRSGLWNVQHVDEQHDPDFLPVMADAVARTTHHRVGTERVAPSTLRAEVTGESVGHP